MGQPSTRTRDGKSSVCSCKAPIRACVKRFSQGYSSGGTDFLRTVELADSCLPTVRSKSCKILRSLTSPGFDPLEKKPVGNTFHQPYHYTTNGLRSADTPSRHKHGRQMALPAKAFPSQWVGTGPRGDRSPDRATRAEARVPPILETCGRRCGGVRDLRRAHPINGWVLGQHGTA